MTADETPTARVLTSHEMPAHVASLWRQLPPEQRFGVCRMLLDYAREVLGEMLPPFEITDAHGAADDEAVATAIHDARLAVSKIKTKAKQKHPTPSESAAFDLVRMCSLIAAHGATPQRTTATVALLTGLAADDRAAGERWIAAQKRSGFRRGEEAKRDAEAKYAAWQKRAEELARETPALTKSRAAEIMEAEGLGGDESIRKNIKKTW